MRITEIDNLLDQAEPLPPTEPPTEPAEPTTAALTTFMDTQRQIAATLAGLADVAALVAQIADLRERVTRLEGAAHAHPGIVPTRAID